MPTGASLVGGTKLGLPLAAAAALYVFSSLGTTYCLAPASWPASGCAVSSVAPSMPVTSCRPGCSLGAGLRGCWALACLLNPKLRGGGAGGGSAMAARGSGARGGAGRGEAARQAAQARPEGAPLLLLLCYALVLTACTLERNVVQRVGLRRG